MKGKLKGRNLRFFVRQNIDAKDAMLITDEYPGYRGMSRVVPHLNLGNSDPFLADHGGPSVFSR